MVSLPRLIAVVGGLVSAFSTDADITRDPDTPTRMTEALVVGNVGRSGRVVFHTDAVEDLLVRGTWITPAEGTSLVLPDGETRTWALAKADDDGTISSGLLTPGYALWRVESASDRVAILDASGHSSVYVNGELRAGDPYRNGIMQLPIRLKSGDNEILFMCARGAVTASLRQPRGSLYFSSADSTIPQHLPALELQHLWFGLVVVNATSEWRDVNVAIEGEPRRGPLFLGKLPPLTSYKFPIAVKTSHLSDSEPASVLVHLQTLSPNDAHETLDSVEFALAVRQPDEFHIRTFVSETDGSAQYYAVNPARGGHFTMPAGVISLHGAGVDAAGQAGSYAQKSWATIIAPTNRRPFGFDWEDWGRLDALEVMAHARQFYGWDPAQTYLTGHSMGGHGTWHLGAIFPDRFAAIGPSAGWISFETYAGGGGLDPEDSMQSLLIRGGGPSRTLDMGRNYAQQGIYILHGDADDNVPVDQARQMVKYLSDFHKDFRVHEQPGAGHWWGNSDEPGASCLDWPQMFDHFARRRLPSPHQVRDISFTTANPGVSASSHWAIIESQIRAGMPSTINLRFDPHQRRISGATTNVHRLAVDLAAIEDPRFGYDPPGRAVRFVLDGQTIEAAATPTSPMKIVLVRDGDQWHALSESDLSTLAAMKNPARNGFFKDAFRHHAILVFGTQGNDDEDVANLTKARYDAETFWYRGNGSLPIISDVDFLAGDIPSSCDDAGEEVVEEDRNVILYGNSETNAAWNTLLPRCPVTVTRTTVRVGSRIIDGEDLATLFIYPRAGSAFASVGVVAGTGEVGTRLVQRIPYFVSGVGIPDLIILNASSLSRGSAGIPLTGFFGNDWSVQSGEWSD